MLSDILLHFASLLGGPPYYLLHYLFQLFNYTHTCDFIEGCDIFNLYNPARKYFYLMIVRSQSIKSIPSHSPQRFLLPWFSQSQDWGGVFFRSME